MGGKIMQELGVDLENTYTATVAAVCLNHQSEVYGRVHEHACMDGSLRIVTTRFIYIAMWFFFE